MSGRSRHPPPLHVFEMMELDQLQQKHPCGSRSEVLETADTMVEFSLGFEEHEEIVVWEKKSNPPEVGFYMQCTTHVRPYRWVQ
jgi:hypothetical protein